MFWQKIYAFIKKEFNIEFSYKFAFFLRIFSILSWILTFYFIDKLFAGNVSSHLLPYGTNYFSYVLIGITFFNYVSISVANFSNIIRKEQLMGTLENLLVTPTKISTLIIAMGIWNFIWASIEVSIYLIMGVFLFGIDLSQINILSTLIILILTFLSFSGLGLVAASFIIVFKRGQPITWTVNTLFEVLGGVYFPITVFPEWLITISKMIPVTYSIKAIQFAVYKNYSLNMLIPEIVTLGLFSITLLPIGFNLLKYAIKKAKKNASLSHY